MPFILILALLFTAQKVAAQDPPKLLLVDVLKTARERNPEISAARKKWQSVQARVGFESGWDKTMVSYETMYKNRERVVGVTQDIPFPGKLTLRGDVARKEAFMAQEDARAKELEVLAKVQEAYAMFFMAQKSIEIYQQNADLMRQLAKSAESKYIVGRAGQVDVLKAQVELSNTLNKLVTLEQEKETAQAMINILLNQDPETTLSVPEELEIKDVDLDYKKLAKIAEGNRPELLEAFHHIHHSKAALRSARLDFLPDFTAQYRRRSADDPEMDGSNEYMVGMKIPLWFGKTTSMIKSSKLEAEMGEAEYQAMKNMTLWSIKDAVVKAQAAARLVKLYKSSVIPQAENALRLTRTAYQSDRAGFRDLIEAQKMVVDFQMEHYEHLTDYFKIIAQLERMVGQPLSEVQP